MRSQFAFYKSFDDVYQDLTDKQKLEFMQNILDVQFLRVKVDEVVFKDTILKHIWNAQKHSIQKSIHGYLESQKSDRVKTPFLGCYDDNFTPIQTPSKGIREEEQEKEEGKEKGKPIPPIKKENGSRIENLSKDKKEELYFFMKKHCNEKNIDEIEIEKFINFWKGETTKKAIKKDWEATFRNWCLKDWVKKKTPTKIKQSGDLI